MSLIIVSNLFTLIFQVEIWCWFRAQIVKNFHLKGYPIAFYPHAQKPQVLVLKIGSLSNDVYERRTSTGSGPFSSLDDGFAQIFNQIVSIRVKKLSNTNFISSRHIKREKSSLPVDVRRSKTSLLKLPNVSIWREYKIQWENYKHCLIRL